MAETMKRPCKKCGRAVIRSPMNRKVKLCDGCLSWPENCSCEPLKPDTDAAFLARLREAYNR